MSSATALSPREGGAQQRSAILEYLCSSNVRHQKEVEDFARFKARGIDGATAAIKARSRSELERQAETHAAQVCALQEAHREKLRQMEVSLDASKLDAASYRRRYEKTEQLRVEGVKALRAAEAAALKAKETHNTECQALQRELRRLGEEMENYDTKMSASSVGGGGGGGGEVGGGGDDAGLRQQLSDARIAHVRLRREMDQVRAAERQLQENAAALEQQCGSLQARLDVYGFADNKLRSLAGTMRGVVEQIAAASGASGARHSNNNNNDGSDSDAPPGTTPDDDDHYHHREGRIPPLESKSQQQQQQQQQQRAAAHESKQQNQHARALVNNNNKHHHQQHLPDPDDDERGGGRPAGHKRAQSSSSVGSVGSNKSTGTSGSNGSSSKTRQTPSRSNSYRRRVRSSPAAALVDRAVALKPKSSGNKHSSSSSSGSGAGAGAGAGAGGGGGAGSPAHSSRRAVAVSSSSASHALLRQDPLATLVTHMERDVAQVMRYAADLAAKIKVRPPPLVQRCRARVWVWGMNE